MSPAPTPPETPATAHLDGPLPALARLLRTPQVHALVAASGATESHVVGGTLRDAILGLPVHDLDVVVAGRGAEIAGDLAATLPGRLIKLGGRDFAAYRLVCPDGMVVDLWDRGQASLRDDLERRDFTVNSLAVDARSGALADPFGGLSDLRHRVLRATTDRSFTGDPLRVLRLARLGLRLPGFAAAPATLDLARRAVPGLAEVAAERIREELGLILCHEQADRGLRTLADLGVYPALWLGPPGGPSAAAGPPPERAIDLAAGEMAALADRVRECAPWLEAGAAASSEAHPSAALDLFSARFAATCRHLAAAADDGGQSALAHLRAAGYLTARQAAAIEPILPAAAAGTATAGTATAGTATAAATAVLPGSEIERRRFIHRHGRRWLTAVCSFGAAATMRGAAALDEWRRRAAPLCALAGRAGPALMAPQRLLTGGDVQGLLGIPPGPRIGDALAALTAAQVDGELHSREEAAAFLQAWFSARRWPVRP
jgi:poly(A) polymerase